MPVSIDHLALPATDAEASARWFAEILGLAAPLPDGPDQDMFNVRLNDSSSVQFVSEPAGQGHHVAFAVSAAELSASAQRYGFGNSLGLSRRQPALVQPGSQDVLEASMAAQPAGAGRERR